MDKEKVCKRLLYVLQARVRQLKARPSSKKVRPPGEAEKFFLSRVEDTNPIKELLFMQSQGENYRKIESRLSEVLETDL